jgi:hypothetical protein
VSGLRAIARRAGLLVKGAQIVYISIEFGNRGIAMQSTRGIFIGSLTILAASVASAWAGAPAPAPLAGVAGPYGLAVAAVGFGGYWLYKRYRRQL